MDQPPQQTPPAQPQPASTNTTNTTNTNTKKRGDNFVTAEDEQLAISWIAISQDPKFANSQTGVEFYERVATHFKAACTIYPRSADQLKYRWKSINTSTLKFSSIYGAVQRNPPSGCSPADYMDIAKKEYQNQCKGQQFKDDVPWQILRYAPKWVQVANPIAKVSNPAVNVANSSISTPSASSPSMHQSTPPPSSDPSERPVGQKKSKRQREERETEAERTKELKRATDIQERKAVVMEKGHELAERALRLEEQAKNLNTLMTSVESCPDEESREILKLMKSKLLKQYREEAERSQDTEN